MLPPAPQKGRAPAAGRPGFAGAGGLRPPNRPPGGLACGLLPLQTSANLHPSHRPRRCPLHRPGQLSAAPGRRPPRLRRGRRAPPAETTLREVWPAAFSLSANLRKPPQTFTHPSAPADAPCTTPVRCPQQPPAAGRPGFAGAGGLRPPKPPLRAVWPAAFPTSANPPKPKKTPRPKTRSGGWYVDGNRCRAALSPPVVRWERPKVMPWFLHRRFRRLRGLFRRFRRRPCRRLRRCRLHRLHRREWGE